MRYLVTISGPEGEPIWVAEQDGESPLEALAALDVSDDERAREWQEQPDGSFAAADPGWTPGVSDTETLAFTATVEPIGEGEE